MRASTSWLACDLILEPAVVGRVFVELGASTSGNRPRINELINGAKCRIVSREKKIETGKKKRMGKDIILIVSL